ncbi:MAG TPA: hypothetical protein VET65_12755 [Candidatus Limnocylindrales bacterium]|nr:hypothetical protein [Candidatus Limnocylindrales bacterium]
MSANVARLPRVAVSLPALIATIAIALLVIAWLSGAQSSILTAAYVIFVALTIRVVRSVPVSAGAWLSRRLVRRTLVAGIALISLDFAAGRGLPFDSGLVLFLALVAGDVVLGRATSRMASAKDEFVDERQEALRNRASRLAYGMVAAATGVIVFGAYVTGPATRAWLDGALHGGPMIAFAQLLLFLPAMLIAWLEPEAPTDEPFPARRWTAPERLAAAMVGIALIVPIVFLVSPVILPVRSTAFQRPESAPAGETCRYFDATREVGLPGAGTTLRLSAVACWNGKTAFEEWGLNDSDCLPSGVIAGVTRLRCSRSVDADGTLHFIYATRFQSALIPTVTRDVVMTLVLAKDGRVVQFP